MSSEESAQKQPVAQQEKENQDDVVANSKFTLSDTDERSQLDDLIVEDVSAHGQAAAIPVKSKDLSEAAMT